MRNKPNRVKLTQLFADRQGPPQEGHTTYWDQTLPGFGLRISSKNRRTWVVTYVVKGGKQVMETVGTMATIPNVGEARGRARMSMNRAREGVHPVEERKEQKAAAEAAAEVKAFTFNKLADQFIREHVERNNRPVSVYESKRMLARVGERWGHRQAQSITKADVYAVIEEIASRRLRKRASMPGPSLVMANAVLRCLRTLFRWAVAKGLVDRDPTEGVLKPLTKETPRDRVLDDREIVLMWNGSDELGWPFGPIAKLLLLTAQRESEVAGMRWSEIDFEKAVWKIPATRAKNAKAHTVALSPLAIEVINAVPNQGDLLFSKTGKTAASGFSNAKERLNAFMSAGSDAPIPRWVWHDLRRTATTGLARLGIAPHIADKILNHSTGTIRGVAAVYNQHAYLDERKAALDVWARFVEGLVRPTPTNNVVVPIRSA